MDHVSNHGFQLLVASKKHQQEAWLDLAQHVLGIRFPEEYVARGAAYSLIDHFDEIVGGVILVSDPPFRSIQAIPPGKQALTSQLAAESQIAEINGIWLANRTRSPFSSFAFWTLLLHELLALDANQFLFTFDNQNKRMNALFKWVRPTVIYSGETRCLPGMNSAACETIALVDRSLIASFSNLINVPETRIPGSVEHELVDRLKSSFLDAT